MESTHTSRYIALKNAVGGIMQRRTKYMATLSVVCGTTSSDKNAFVNGFRLSLIPLCEYYGGRDALRFLKHLPLKNLIALYSYLLPPKLSTTTATQILTAAACLLDTHTITNHIWRETTRACFVNAPEFADVYSTTTHWCTDSFWKWVNDYGHNGFVFKTTIVDACNRRASVDMILRNRETSSGSTSPRCSVLLNVSQECPPTYKLASFRRTDK